jgi:YidC/Oxa1 family membrane protein insertase
LKAKDTVIALVAAAAAALIWLFVAPKFLPEPKPQPEQTEQQDKEKEGQGGPDATTQPDGDQTPPPPADTQPVTTQPTSQPAAVPTKKVVAVLPADALAEPDLVLGSIEKLKDGGKADYFWLRATLSNRGAGILEAELTDFYVTPRRKEHYAIIPAPVDNGSAEPEKDKPLAMASGQVAAPDLWQVDLSDEVWRAVGRSQAEDGSSQSVTFATEIQAEDGKPLLRIEKTFTLAKGSFELQVGYKLISRSGEMKVTLTDAGIASIPQEGVRDERKVILGTAAKDAKTAAVGAKGRSELVATEKEDKLGVTTDDEGLVWVGQTNRFFAVVLRPTDPRAHRLEYRYKPLGKSEKYSAIRVWFVSDELTVAAEKPLELGFSNFVGAKDRHLFADVDAYKRLNYGELITFESCCCAGYLRPLVSVMLWLMDMFHAVFGNFGVAIMLLVAIVRVLLHPLTKKSQVTMSRMSKMGPKMEELKKKYGDNKTELNKAMAQLYKEEGFNPMLGCLPMLLQMPIWIALWGGLRAAIELRHAPFIGWINDLSAPDALYAWAEPANGYVVPWIGGLIGPVFAFNLLPILLMVAMFLQQKLTPKTGTADQIKQQKLVMYLMSGFFGLIFYNLPSGLTLYVMASTAVGAGEQYFIRKKIREEDEAKGPAAGGGQKPKPEQDDSVKGGAGRPDRDRKRR